MALNVLGAQFDKLLNVTLCYPENSSRPFYDMLSGKLTRIVVRVNTEQIQEELHGDYVNDKGFKRRFQLWLNTLWSEKDAQIDAIKATNKKPVNDRLSILFLTNQNFTVSAYCCTKISMLLVSMPCGFYGIYHSRTSPERPAAVNQLPLFLLRHE